MLVQEIEHSSSHQSEDVSLETQPIVALGRFALFKVCFRFRLSDHLSIVARFNAFAHQVQHIKDA